MGLWCCVQVMGLIAAAQEDENCLKFDYGSSSVLCGGGLDTKLTMPLGHEMIVDEPSNMPGTAAASPNISEVERVQSVW